MTTFLVFFCGLLLIWTTLAACAKFQKWRESRYTYVWFYVDVACIVINIFSVYVNATRILYSS